mgnify:CR=1 FL=1|jgi:hypothetical protein
MTLFLLPPLVASTAHLLTDSPYAVDFAVQFAVMAAVLVLIGDSAGHKAAWWISAPLIAAGVSGILLHRVGDGLKNAST